MSAGASRWFPIPNADAPDTLVWDTGSNDPLELAQQLANVGHWRISLPDHAMTWSTTTYHLHGVTSDCYEPTLNRAIGFYHPEDRDAVAAAITVAIQSGTPFEIAARLIRPDGSLRHVKSRGLRLFGRDLKPSAIFGVLIDVTEQQEAYLQLERIAYKDVLTELANRRQFDEVLEREWRRAIRDRTALSLIILDVDRFKMYNDAFGHPAGDDCLRSVARVVASAVRRPGDLAVRYGGEEFALILPVTQAEEAEKIAQRVRAAIEGLDLTHTGNVSCGRVVTASFGVSSAFPMIGETVPAPQDLVAEADRFLYEAKRTGRNRVVSRASIGSGGRAALPSNEADRLTALHMYERAGACRRTPELDRIAKLAATLFATPIGLVSLVGQVEQIFIGNYGLDGLESAGREIGLCGHTILGDDPFVVPDATCDSRFVENLLVKSDFGLRYYAGAPIVSPTSNHRLGTLCVMDRTARAETGQAQRALLTDLAKMAGTLLDEKMAPWPSAGAAAD